MGKAPRVPTLKTRVHGLYSGMKLRFAERKWNSGKRQGQVRVPGQELPFGESDLLRWMEECFPNGSAHPCRYCGVPIDALSASPDHDIPVSRGGSLSINNLVDCCAPCNRLKGALSGEEFKRLRAFIESLPLQAQYELVNRLKAGAMGMRLRFYGGRK